MFQEPLLPTILQYIVDKGLRPEGEGDSDSAKLLPMDELCRELGVSRGKLREQLVAAAAWGVVDMRPGDGTYVQPVDFYTPVRTLLLYGVTLDRRNFDRYYELRTRLEVAFWEDATSRLTSEDKALLQQILQRAESKLSGQPVEIPHREHRELHMMSFCRLENDYVVSLLRAYWDAYEAVGLHLYFDYDYYEEMWSSHRAMVDAIVAGRYAEGREILAQHFTLLRERLKGQADG